MTTSELHGWAKYLSIEPANSVEIQTALVAQVANNAMGGKAKLTDMLITQHRKEKTIESEVAKRPDAKTVDFIFSAFKK